MSGEKKGPRRKMGPVTRERIRLLADMMASGTYVTRDTPRLLAAKWGCKPKSVENLACQAANLLRLSLGDDAQIRNKILGQLDRTTALCMKRATEVYPEGHERAGELKERNAYQWLNTLIQATDRIASLTGINAPKKVELKSEFTLDDLETVGAAVEANQCPSNESTYSGTPCPTSGLSADSSKLSPSPDDAKS